MHWPYSKSDVCADMQVDGYLCLDFNLFHLFPLFLLVSHMRVWGTPSRLDYSLYLVMSKNYLSESKLLQRVYFSYSFEKNVRKKNETIVFLGIL